MLRTILGILAGLVAMFATITAIEYLGQIAFPPPPGLDPTDPAQLEQIMARVPVAAKALVVAAWAAGAFVGGWVAARIARPYPRSAALAVAAAVMLGVVAIIVAMPAHPVWMSVLGLLLPVPLALLAAGLARPRGTLR